MELLFKVTEQIIEHLTTEKKVVANSKNYLKCKFEFSEEWQGVTKTAIFTAATGKAFEYILENDACVIPYEVIDYPHFTVSVFGGDLITVNSVSVNVLKSGYKEGEIPKNPTPDVYSQILQMVDEAISRQPQIGVNNNWWIWDAKNKNYIDTGVSAEGYVPKRGVDYWTPEDKQTVKLYIDEQIGFALEADY